MAFIFLICYDLLQFSKSFNSLIVFQFDRLSKIILQRFKSTTKSSWNAVKYHNRISTGYRKRLTPFSMKNLSLVKTISLRNEIGFQPIGLDLSLLSRSHELETLGELGLSLLFVLFCLSYCLLNLHSSAASNQRYLRLLARQFHRFQKTSSHTGL